MIRAGISGKKAKVYATVLSKLLKAGMSRKGMIARMFKYKHSLLVQEIEQRGLSIAENLSHNQYFSTAAERMGMSNKELTDYLWATYQPSSIWMVIFGIGIFAAISLWVYNRFLVSSEKY